MSSSRRDDLLVRLRWFVRSVEAGDESMVEEVLRLSSRRRLFAPLAYLVGAFAMLFDGVKLLFTNWRLTLIQVLPAMWIWAAMFDLKAHVLHDRAFHVMNLLEGWSPMGGDDQLIHEGLVKIS